MRVLDMRIAYQCSRRLEFLHFLYLISYSCNSLCLRNKARRGDMFMYLLAYLLSRIANAHRARKSLLRGAK